MLTTTCFILEHFVIVNLCQKIGTLKYCQVPLYYSIPNISLIRCLCLWTKVDGGFARIHPQPQGQIVIIQNPPKSGNISYRNMAHQ